MVKAKKVHFNLEGARAFTVTKSIRVIVATITHLKTKKAIELDSLFIRIPHLVFCLI